MSDTLIRDNKNYGSVGEFLKDVIKKNEEEHRNFDNRINSIEIKQAI